MSKISIRIAEERDHSLWDAYVIANPTVSPYSKYAWRVAVARAYGFHAFYLLAERDRDIIGILPLIHLRVPCGFSTLVSLPYCDVGGIYAEDEEVEILLLQGAMQLCDQIRAGNLLIRGDREFYPYEFTKAYACSSECGKVSMRLALPMTVEILWNSFKSKLRSQVVKAEKNGLGFKWGNQSNLDTFYNVYSENMRDLGSPVHSKKWFDSVLAGYGEDAKIGVINIGEKVIGCGFIICGSGAVVLPWASTLREYNRLSPNMLLYWNFLKFAIERGYKEFDFGRSTPGEGTYKFKKQWGADEHLLYVHSFQKNSKKLKFNASIICGKKQLASIWSKFPLPVANMIGPILRKYISL